MTIVRKDNHNPISKADLNTAMEMLKASIDSHIKEIEKQKPRLARVIDEDEADQILASMKKIYKQFRKDMPKYFKEMEADPKEISLEDILEGYIPKIDKKVMKTVFPLVTDQNYRCYLKPDEDVHSYDMPGHADEEIELQIKVYDHGFHDFFTFVGDKDIMLLGEGEDVTKYVENKDYDADYAGTIGGFVKDETILKGIEEIADYATETETAGDHLLQARTGNSETLNKNFDHVIDDMLQMNNANPDDANNFDKRREMLDNYGKAAAAKEAFVKAAEWSRQKAVDLIRKPAVSFSDLYGIFTSLNKLNRPDDPDGGRIRASFVEYGENQGLATSMIPADLYKTLSSVAEGINAIKRIEDRNLQKSQAIRLAAFTYQAFLSEHCFQDGNGRTCRLFADTILQTFHLPPHTPSKAENKIARTVDGKPLDYKKGTEVFLAAVKESGKAIAEDHENIAAGKEETRDAAFYRIYYKLSVSAGGAFRDSEVYQKFQKSAEFCKLLSERIERSERHHRQTICVGDEKISLAKAKELLQKADRRMQKNAHAYIDYKMKDHTANPELEPDKKKLNTKDMEKLNLVSFVLPDQNVLKRSFAKLDQMFMVNNRSRENAAGNLITI